MQVADIESVEKYIKLNFGIVKDDQIHPAYFVPLQTVLKSIRNVPTTDAADYIIERLEKYIETYMKGDSELKQGVMFTIDLIKGLCGEGGATDGCQEVSSAG